MWCVEVVGGVWRSYVVCGSRMWCVEVVAGVYKSYVVCTSRMCCVQLRWCVQAVIWGGTSRESWVLCGCKVWQIPKQMRFIIVSGHSEHF